MKTYNTKIRISITREVTGRVHECAETFHREITNEEAAECIKDLFLSIADGAKNEQ